MLTAIIIALLVICALAFIANLLWKAIIDRDDYNEVAFDFDKAAEDPHVLGCACAECNFGARWWRPHRSRTRR